MPEKKESANDAPSPPVPAVTARIRLTHAHGFMDENDTHRFWKAGDVVSDPATVAMLKDRGASHEII